MCCYRPFSSDVIDSSRNGRLTKAQVKTDIANHRDFYRFRHLIDIGYCEENIERLAERYSVIYYLIAKSPMKEQVIS